MYAIYIFILLSLCGTLTDFEELLLKCHNKNVQSSPLVTFRTELPCFLHIFVCTEYIYHLCVTYLWNPFNDFWRNLNMYTGRQSGISIHAKHCSLFFIFMVTRITYHLKIVRTFSQNSLMYWPNGTWEHFGWYLSSPYGIGRQEYETSLGSFNVRHAKSRRNYRLFIPPLDESQGVYRDPHVRSYVRLSHFWFPDNN